MFGKVGPKKQVIVTITDLNGDGLISRSELRKALREALGVNLFSGLLKCWNAARNADTNHDGFISKEEIEVLKNHASRQWNLELIVVSSVLN